MMARLGERENGTFVLRNANEKGKAFALLNIVTKKFGDQERGNTALRNIMATR